MAMTTTSFSSYYQSINLHRSPHPLVQNTRRLSWNPASKNGFVHSFAVNRRGRRNGTIKMDLNAFNSDVVSGVSPDFHFPDWSKWVLVSAVPLIASFLTAGKWGPLLKMKDQVDATLDKVEDASEVIEDIARKVDNIADSIVENLPEGKLRDAVDKFDDLAEQTIQATDNAQELLHKVDEFSNELDEILEESGQTKEQVSSATAKVAEEKVKSN